MPLSSILIATASQVAPRLSSRLLASSGYTLDPRRLGDDSVYSAWSAETAERQNRAWMPIVEAARAGKPREDVVALFDALADVEASVSTVLEVGCGGGYNSELIAMRRPELRYTGVDLSSAMIELCKRHYPERTFATASAYDLDFADHSFDIVLDGVALLHMLRWQTALAQYARVSADWVILHGLTLSDSSPTTAFAKYAYGQPSHELIFNRGEMLTECEAVGLGLESRHPCLDYDLKRYLGITTVSETWVLRHAKR